MRSCFCVYQDLVTPWADQETSVSAGVLDGHTHEPVDELFEHYLARECLGDLDHGGDIKLFDRCFDRARWTPLALVRPQPRMELIELPHLSVGAPAQIAGPGLPQIGVCECREAARRVEAGSELVGERLVVNEAIRACRPDCLFVKTLGVQHAAFEAGDLSAHQRCTILEILRTICCPVPKMLLVTLKRFATPRVRI